MGMSPIKAPSTGYGERPTLSNSSMLKGSMIDAQKFASKLMAKPLKPFHNIGTVLGNVQAPKRGKANY
jgi:hypothetical protein